MKNKGISSSAVYILVSIMQRKTSRITAMVLIPNNADQDSINDNSQHFKLYKLKITGHYNVKEPVKLSMNCTTNSIMD